MRFGNYLGTNLRTNPGFYNVNFDFKYFYKFFNYIINLLKINIYNNKLILFYYF